MTTLALLSPIDPATGERVAVRVCSSQDSDATGASGYIWWPAIVREPSLSVALFDGDFTSAVQPGSAQIDLSLGVLTKSGAFDRVLGYDWSGAKAVLYRLEDGLPASLASMKVERFAVEGMRLSLSLAIDEEPLAADVLFRTYAGTTGSEGGADLKDQPKPWVFGRARNVEPVFIDQIDNVFQVSGYGPVAAISAAYENGASFGASVGDFANYASLVAADITEGRWGTCLAEGMFRLGAPPAGVITCDVDGDNTAGFLRRTGAIIKEIARRLGRGDSINTESLDALDQAVPRNVNIVISEQIGLLDLARQMAAPCNAVAGLGYDGRLIVPRVAFGEQAMILDAQGRQMPPVLGMARQNTSPPYKRIKMGAARSWRVHSLEEISFYADLIDRGLYDAATVYREGNMVSRIDKSRWLYINETPGSGNAPPVWPATSNAFWDNLEPPASEDPAISNASIMIAGGVIDGIGTSGVFVDNGLVMVPGLEASLPATGDFDGQQIAAGDTGEIYRWDESGMAWVLVSDTTAPAQRTIEAEFPVIEIKEGEAGHTGNRTVAHVAKRGTAALSGGTWSLPVFNLGAGSASINSSTGTVTLSGIVQSGAYAIRYTHTDGFATDFAINVTYVPAAAAGVVSAKTARATSINGTFNNNNWQDILTLTVTAAPAGRVSFGGFEGLSFLDVVSGTDTADFEARLQMDGVTLTSVASQNLVTGGVVSLGNFTDLFTGRFDITSGNRTFVIQLRRTSGAGTLTQTSTALEATVIAT